MKIQKVTFDEVKHLIPANCLYQHEEGNTPILYAEGNQEWDEPIDLDQPFNDSEFDTEIPFILVNGNLVATQIFNEETDGSTGLIVLGDLQADNMVVGGQGIYVLGDLTVQGLFWGDYNHGDLHVEGNITTGAFINTDYSVQFQRFHTRDRIDIRQLLWDETDSDYEDKTRIDAILKPEFIVAHISTEDELYSWKEWIDDAKVFEALRENKPLLQDTPLERATKPEYPFLFDSEEINEQNLIALSAPQFYSFKEAQCGEDNEFEYWQDNVLKRIYSIPGQPHASIVYIQYDEDYACMVYFGQDSSLLDKITGKKDFKLTMAYRPDLNKEKWLKLDDGAPQVYRDFLAAQWKKLLHELSEMLYLQKEYDTYITVERFDAIMKLPIVRHYGKRYYKDDPSSVIYFRGTEWQFRNARADQDEEARITIAKPIGQGADGEDEYEFFHFEKELDADGQEVIVILTQEDNDYDADIYELFIHDIDQFRKAVQHYKRLDQYIDARNNAWRKSSS